MSIFKANPFGDDDFHQMDYEQTNDWFSTSLSNMGLGAYSFRFYALSKGEPFENGMLCDETFEWVLDRAGIHAVDATWSEEATSSLESSDGNVSDPDGKDID